VNCDGKCHDIDGDVYMYNMYNQSSWTVLLKDKILMSNYYDNTNNNV